VISAEQNQPAALLEELAKAGLNLFYSSHDVEGCNRQVASVGDLRLRERLNAQYRVVGTQQA